MNVIGRLLAVVVGGFVLSAIGASIAAMAAKRRIVPLDDPEADEVRLVAIFEPIQFHSTAKTFRGGSLDCWYGGGVVDLRDATLDPAGARLEVRAIFGGAQLVVPDSWRVTTNLRGPGGIGDARRQIERPVTAPLLVIDGLVVMGGFGITSELSPQQAQAVSDAVARRGRRNGVVEMPEATPVA